MLRTITAIRALFQSWLQLHYHACNRTITMKKEFRNYDSKFPRCKMETHDHSNFIESFIFLCCFQLPLLNFYTSLVDGYKCLSKAIDSFFFYFLLEPIPTYLKIQQNRQHRSSPCLRSILQNHLKMTKMVEPAQTS